MLYALNHSKNKFTVDEAKEMKLSSQMICPCCGDKVIPVAGDITIHHWRHTSGDSKCFFHVKGTETLWHSTMKFNFGREFVETIVERNGEKRIADVMLKNGTVIEYQHSGIDAAEKFARREFYGNMHWVFDASGPMADGRIWTENNVFYFWDKPRRTIEKGDFIDVGVSGFQGEDTKETSRIWKIKSIESEIVNHKDFDSIKWKGHYEDFTLSAFRKYINYWDEYGEDEGPTKYLKEWSIKHLNKIHTYDPWKTAQEFNMP